MNVIVQRIPTKRETILLLMVCVLPIHIRSILIFLYGVPAFLLSSSIWDTIGIFSYVQVFSLLESLLIIAAFIFICISLPKKIFKDKFLVQGTIIVLMTSLWVIPLHYQTQILSSLNWDMRVYQFLATVWIIAFFVVMGFVSKLIHSNQKTENLINKSIERVLPLSMIYIFVDAICFLVIVYRFIV